MGPAAEPQIWLARTGEGGYAFADCMAAGVVALRYDTVGDARSMTRAEIAAAVGKAGTRVSLSAVAAMLERFVHDVRIGDIVVTPHIGSREVFFGEVTGDYEWCDPSPVPGFRHLRPVRWWGSLDRDTDITSDRRVEMDRQPTFYLLPDQKFWRERANTTRAITSQVVPPRRMTRAAAGTPTASPRRTAVDTNRCRVCGVRKPASIVHEGVCSDCD